MIVRLSMLGISSRTLFSSLRPSSVVHSRFNHHDTSNALGIFAPLSSIALLSVVQKPAPDFSVKALINGEFKTITRHELLGQYWVLFFYPLDFTFVCPTEIIAFNDRLSEFEAVGCRVLAASVDSEHAHLAWTQLPRSSGGLGPTRLPLLSDSNHTLSTSYSVLLSNIGVALRGLFIMDKKGIVRHQTVNDLGIGRSVDETLRVVKAIQFVDEHGEVCPADWKPGAKTIKANPKDAKAFFAGTGK